MNIAKMQDVRKQIVTGLVPPQSGEAIIRDVWPSVAARPPIAALGRALTRTIILAPLAWLLMAPFYFLRVVPFLARRYTLTNRRLMIRRWPKFSIVKEVPLSAIDDVRIQSDGNSQFFRTGNLEIISKGSVVMTLAGVPEPESFRHGVIQAYTAWVPGKSAYPFVPAKAPAPASA
jgi:hypothetical protein